MLFLEDPDQRPGLWESWRDRLSVEEVCCVVSDGRGNLEERSRVLGRSMIDELELRLRSLTIRRIGASHGNAIAPYFGLGLYKDEATVREFITYPAPGQRHVAEDRLRRDLESLAVDLFFFRSGVRTLSVPLSIESWTFDAVASELSDGSLRIVRATA